MRANASALPDRPAVVPRGRQLLLVCGILSSVIYVALNVFGALRWEGYSSSSQAVSELFAIDAPSRSVVVPLGIAYDLLLMAFGIGVWNCAGRRRGLRVSAGLLFAIGALGLGWPPMHLRGAEKTLTDTLHIVFASAVVLVTLAAIGFGATAFGRRFRVYSIATIVILVIFGVMAGLDGPRLGAGLPTPWLGVTERINIGGYLLWVAALAIVLLRTHSAVPSLANGPSTLRPVDRQT
jgi:hypothetical protein